MSLQTSTIVKGHAYNCKFYLICLARVKSISECGKKARKYMKLLLLLFIIERCEILLFDSLILCTMQKISPPWVPLIQINYAVLKYISDDVKCALCKLHRSITKHWHKFMMIRSNELDPGWVTKGHAWSRFTNV